MENFFEICNTYVDVEVFEQMVSQYEILDEVRVENASSLTMREDKIKFDVCYNLCKDNEVYISYVGEKFNK